MGARKVREERRAERIAAESEAAASTRRGRALRLAAGAGFLALLAVVAVIIAGAGSGKGGDPTHIVDAGVVDALLANSPQQRLTIGQADAPVHLFEYGDLQCPYCKAFSEAEIPAAIEGPVDAGKAKITFRNLLIIGPDSLPAGAAAIAAGEQGRGWNYIETFYRNQAEENSGYVTEAFLEAVARAAGVKDMATWNKRRKSRAVREEATKTTESAETKLGFHATPSFAIEGPNTDGLEILGTPESAEQLEEAIARAG
ncbi:MAG TPA: thioredoxin domain-containing protein [Solirubrobacterales bacterium]|jgi:protein-disulfide isomerase